MSIWKRVKTVAVIIITTVLVPAQQSEKANKALQNAPGTASSATAIEGAWSVTPLVMKGVAVPGGAGQLLEFGESFPTESFLAFWARTGPNPDKDWVLFSWKDSKLTRVLQRGVEFVAPDSRKITIEAGTRIHAGKRLLYFSKFSPHHVYAWDGEKLLRVLSKGDQLQFGNESYNVNRARVLDIAPDGKALIAFSARDQHVTGWALHDGSSFSVLLIRRSLSSKLVGYLCLEVWDAMGYWPARMLEEMLSIRNLSGHGLSNGNPKNLCENLRQFAAFNVEYGPVSLYPLNHIKGESWVTHDGWASIAPDSPNSLAAEVSVEWKVGWVAVKIRSHPHLYFWTGEKLSSVAWEESVGIGSADMPEQLQRSPGFNFNDEEVEAAGKVAHIRIRAIPGPIGGVRVQLPALGDKPRTWYVPANSTDGKLQQSPRFPVAEHAIGLADVTFWKENEVLALTEEGLFRLRRVEQ